MMAGHSNPRSRRSAPKKTTSCSSSAFQHQQGQGFCTSLTPACQDGGGVSPSTAPGGAGVPHPAPFPKSGMSPRSGAPDRASGWIWAPSTRRHPAPCTEEVTRQCQLCNPLGWQGLGWGNLGLGILEVHLYSGDCWDTSPTHAALAALQPLSHGVPLPPGGGGHGPA